MSGRTNSILCKSATKKGIYSDETALYLLGYSDIAPVKYTMTFPKEYDTPSIQKKPVLVKRAAKGNVEIGITQIQSPSLNPIWVYDSERTLCDILRVSGADISLVVDAVKRYAASKEKNVFKWMQ